MDFLISSLENDLYTFLVDERGRTVEIHRQEAAAESIVHTGGIYVGRVMDVVHNLEAAFVNIGAGQNVYLPFDQLIDPIYVKKGSSPHIQQGDELIVQVIREAVKTKAAAVTTNLTLRGRYAAVTWGNHEKGVSKKIPHSRRQELKTFLHGDGFTGRVGVILRTNAAEAAEEDILKEYRILTDAMDTLIRRAAHIQVPCALHTEEPYLNYLMDLHAADTAQILVDNTEIYDQVHAYLVLHHPELIGKLKLYEDTLQTMDKAWSLSRRLKEGHDRRVWLKSGAYILIEPAETLTAIDVNTGKIGRGKLRDKREETFYEINREAAREIAAQIRLRGISGMILVDFISMESSVHQEALMQYFNQCCRNDPVPTRVIDMTALGLVEVTRQRRERGLQ